MTTNLPPRLPPRPSVSPGIADGYRDSTQTGRSSPAQPTPSSPSWASSFGAPNSGHSGPLQRNALSRPGSPTPFMAANRPRANRLPSAASTSSPAASQTARGVTPESLGMDRQSFMAYVQDVPFKAQNHAPSLHAQQQQMEQRYLQQLQHPSPSGHPVELHFDDQGNKYFLAANNAPPARPAPMNLRTPPPVPPRHTRPAAVAANSTPATTSSPSNSNFRITPQPTSRDNEYDRRDEFLSEMHDAGNRVPGSGVPSSAAATTAVPPPPYTPHTSIPTSRPQNAPYGSAQPPRYTSNAQSSTTPTLKQPDANSSSRLERMAAFGRRQVGGHIGEMLQVPFEAREMGRLQGSTPLNQRLDQRADRLETTDEPGKFLGLKLMSGLIEGFNSARKPPPSSGG